MKITKITLAILSLIFPLIYGFTLISPDKLADGYLINQDGEKKNVKIVLLKKEVLVPEKSKYDFSEYKLVTKGQFINDEGKKENITASYKEFGFEYNGDKFVFQIVRVRKVDSFFGTNITDKFCKLVIDGKCKLYHNIEEGKSDLGGPAVQTNYIIVKEGYQPFMAYVNAMGKRLTKSQNDISFEDLFKDCIDLQKKIDKKEFTSDKYSEAVEYYNSSCQ